MRKNTVFGILTVILSLLLLELSLRITAALSPGRISGVLSPEGIPDKTLIYRPNPDYPGHDTNGFRNKTVPGTADIVVLGDSQTYGYRVEREEAWPQQLGKLTGLTVYNMAYGGYGPTHGLILLDEAMRLKPKIIIQAFYMGNDLHDSYRHVYWEDQLPDLRSRDEQIIRAMEMLGGAEALREDIDRHFEELVGRAISGRSMRSEFLRRHSMLYCLCLRFAEEARVGWRRLPFMKRWDKRTRTGFRYYQDETLRTVFFPRYRWLAENLDDMRIREGLRVSLEAIQRMNDICQSRGIRMIVLLIPTKELAFEAQIRKVGLFEGDMKNLIENEKKVLSSIQDSLARQQIDFVEVLPAFTGLLRQGIQPYRTSQDGHPNNIGYAAMAQVVRSTLSRCR